MKSSHATADHRFGRKKDSRQTVFFWRRYFFGCSNTKFVMGVYAYYISTGFQKSLHKVHKNGVLLLCIIPITRLFCRLPFFSGILSGGFLSEKFLELSAPDFFAFNQQGTAFVKYILIFLQEIPGLLIAFVHDPPDFLIDLGGSLIRISLCMRQIPADKHLAVFGIIVNQPETVRRGWQ